MTEPHADISTISSQSSVSKLEALSRTPHNEKEVDKVASEFQEMYYAHMVKAMFATTEDSAIWGDSHASGILRSMFIDAVAHAGGAESLGIKACIKKSLYDKADIENPFQDFLNDHEQLRETVDVLL